MGDWYHNYTYTTTATIKMAAGRIKHGIWSRFRLDVFRRPHQPGTPSCTTCTNWDVWTPFFVNCRSHQNNTFYELGPQFWVHSAVVSKRGPPKERFLPSRPPFSGHSTSAGQCWTDTTRLNQVLVCRARVGTDSHAHALNNIRNGMVVSCRRGPSTRRPSLLFLHEARAPLSVRLPASHHWSSQEKHDPPECSTVRSIVHNINESPNI